MGMRYIKYPEGIVFKDRKTGEPVLGDKKEPVLFDMDTLMDKVVDNPKWNSTYKLGACMDDILTAWESRDEVNRVFVLSEEDWKELLSAAENPVHMNITPRGVENVPGLGYHPRLLRQTLPFTECIVKASSKDPRVVEEVKEAQKKTEEAA